ncbi:MAG: hypothetical protein IPG64_16855 [Haliea sp.]|nr:hypothetical protein [Haliea sp.]
MRLVLAEEYMLVSGAMPSVAALSRKTTVRERSSRSWNRLDLEFVRARHAL